MLKVIANIPETTIELENDRHPETLSYDELLYWTFGTQFEFIESIDEKTMLVLPEAALFQILKLFSDVVKISSENGENEVFAGDRGGAFDLVIRTNQEYVEISETFDNICLQIPLGDFIRATISLINESLDRVEAKCPKLNMNQHYRDLKSSLQG